MSARHTAHIHEITVADENSGSFNGTTAGDDLHGGGDSDILSGFDGNDILCGNADDDKIFGGNGNDMLDGGMGADTMTGGAGSDMYYVDNARDKVIEGTDPGQDTVHSTITYTLTANVEYLELDNSGGAINGTGNTLNNVITGNDSANFLNGSDGDDLLHGGLGNDLLLGGKGNDTLEGGAGTDRLTGGAGADTFVFKSADADTITDFSAGDMIDIRDVLTGYAGGSLDAFVHLAGSGRNTIVSVDADGAAHGENFVAVATLTDVNISSLVDADTMAAHGSLIA